MRAIPQAYSRESLLELEHHKRQLADKLGPLACQASLRHFVQEAWPHVDAAPFKSNWVTDAICDHLEAVMMGHIPNLLINVPPRCSKTTIVSIMFPAWVWLRHEDISPLSGPQVRFLTASYSDKLALISSTAFRRLVKSEWYSAMYPQLEFTRDQDAKGHMDNNMRGSRQSTSVGGTLLGLGGDIIIADDLNNTETEKLVETGAERNAVKGFFDELRSTRRNNPKDGFSAVIGVQQRTFIDDMSGHWIENEDNLTHLCIPMRHDPRRHCRTIILPQFVDQVVWEDERDPDGEDLMWPEYFGEFEVSRLERALGPIMSAGRLQQSPRAKGGNILNPDWWQLWDANAARQYGLQWDSDRREFPECELVVASLDTAQKEGEENDYNALTVWGVFQDKGRLRRAVMMYAWRDRKPLNGKEAIPYPNEPPVLFEKRKKEEWGLVQHVAEICRRYRVTRMLIEDKTRGHDVAAELRRQYARENWGVELINPTQDKVSRCHSVVPLFTDNAIWAPDTRWAQQVIEECENFPKAVHDDYVDSVTQFVLWCRNKRVLVMADEATAFEEESMRWKPKVPTVAEQYGI